MPIALAFACPGCGAPVEGEIGEATKAMECAACKAVTALPEAPALAASLAADACPLCGGKDMYQQRDFNRKLGLALAGLGLLSGPFTHWIGTVAMIGVDALLYLLVPPVAICYACEAQQRGFDKAKGPAGFDIAIHDAYKFAKRFPPRHAAAVAGPLAKRLEFERRRP